MNKATIHLSYQTRVSKRAKRLQIRVKPTGEVEVVLPLRCDPALVPTFVSQNEAWIRNTLQRVTVTQPVEGYALPELVSLRALNQQWQVRYARDEEPRALVVDHVKRELQLCGSNRQQHQKQLIGWLHQHARATLSPWLRDLSQALNLPFNKLTIRGQKTRWGSCSAKRNININRNLLFLEAKLVHYLFVHELCHTIHLNHSESYWALVEKMEPNYRYLDRKLRRAIDVIPTWARCSR